MGMLAAEWKALVHLLRTRLPMSKARRLVVRRCMMSERGCTTLSDNETTITITIASRLSSREQQDILIHEWGHALAFDKEDAHDEEWGKWTAVAYRLVIEAR